MLLAIDTSTRQAGIALYDGDRGLLAEYNWLSANRHTEELLPAIAQMLERAEVAPGRLAAVGVAIGPGSFTGLRVGLAAAKGLALARGLKLVGVSTLDFTAYPHQAQARPVIALVQAGRGRVCWARYEHGPAGWAASAPYTLATLPALAAAVAEPVVFVGELSQADRQALADQLGPARGEFLPPALSARRAACLAELAWAHHAAGRWADPATLSPLYMQQPDGSVTPAAASA
ncbi:MAG: tRNA threonylcarbamoyladenosine biosynthesis protein TsaB [Chloroflexi bacterium ADurb.Bin325]|nr:MAG: tRNA threonylcarbamoyladenosine biosynthesis protein TsaB [Chloroflexi bacterium ADurb.Bin325]